MTVDTAQVEDYGGPAPLCRITGHFRKHGRQWFLNEVQNESEASEFEEASGEPGLTPANFIESDPR